MYELEAERIKDCAQRLHELRRCLNVDASKAKIAALEEEMTVDGFWNDPEAAQKVVQRLKALKNAVNAPDELTKEIDDARDLIELAAAEEDEPMAEELATLVAIAEEKLNKLELSSLLTDPRDDKNAIVNIHPGAGGTESCDWAAMLFRMVTRWCERHDYQVEVVDYLDGEEAGLKSATFTVSGPLAYGYLKGEAGVHRLVRISPFDAAKRRHTSFAAVEVLAEIDQNIEIEVREEDLKMDVFRSSGAGGQKVNKTSSAVRLTHLPTGIVTSCQIERSQHQNRAMALQMLKAKLYDIELKRKEAELAALREGQQDVAWGSQIRSYVLCPYQLVKDHRTNTETGNVDRVLDGDIDLFIEAYLKWKLAGKAQTP